jgi:hypothetical protein
MSGKTLGNGCLSAAYFSTSHPSFVLQTKGKVAMKLLPIPFPIAGVSVFMHWHRSQALLLRTVLSCILSNF